MSVLDELKNKIAKETYKITSGKAIEQGICIDCKKPILNKLNTKLDEDEYFISGLCPKCFDLVADYDE